MSDEEMSKERLVAALREARAALAEAEAAHDKQFAALMESAGALASLLPDDEKRSCRDLRTEAVRRDVRRWIDQLIALVHETRARYENCAECNARLPLPVPPPLCAGCVLSDAAAESWYCGETVVAGVAPREPRPVKP